MNYKKLAFATAGLIAVASTYLALDPKAEKPAAQNSSNTATLFIVGETVVPGSPRTIDNFVTLSVAKMFYGLKAIYIPDLQHKYSSTPEWYNKIPPLLDDMDYSRSFDGLVRRRQFTKADTLLMGERIKQTYEIAARANEPAAATTSQDLALANEAIRYVLISERVQQKEQKGQLPIATGITDKQITDALNHAAGDLGLSSQQLTTYLAFYAKFDEKKPKFASTVGSMQ